MLTREENDMLTRVGRGTPAGELLRRYWQPLAAAAELTEAKADYVGSTAGRGFGDLPRQAGTLRASRRAVSAPQSVIGFRPSR